MQKNLKIAGAVVLLLFAVWRLISVLQPARAPGEVYTMYRQLGELSARETLSLLPKGTEILLVTRADASPHAQQAVTTFVNLVSKGGLVVSRVLKAEGTQTSEEGGLTPEYYAQLVAQAPRQGAIVSFAGAPSARLLRSQDARYGGMFIAILPNQLFLEEQLAAGWVRLAILPGMPPANFRAQLGSEIPVTPPATAPVPSTGIPEGMEFIDDHLTPIRTR